MTGSALTRDDLIYVAALIDTLATLKIRRTDGKDLPSVIVQGGKYRTRAVTWLCELTDTNMSTVRRNYARPSCVSHCPIPHIHVESSGIRWNVTGMKATIVLSAVLPHLRFQADEARDLVRVGLEVGYSTTVVNRMAALGWPVPELRAQPRARILRAAP